MNLSENQKQSSLPRPWLLYWTSEKVVIGGQKSLASFLGVGNPANVFPLSSDLQKFPFFFFFLFMQTLG